jgi:predicted permease
MATTTIRYAASATRVGRTRALSVAGAVLAAAAVWAVAVPLSGTHLLIRFGSGAAQSVGIEYVVGASLAASLAGWGLLSLLERRTARARRIWTGIAIVVVVLSLGLPVTAGTTMSSKVALALMHVAVAAVLIPSMRRSSAASTE